MLTSMDIKKFVVKKINDNFKEKVLKNDIEEDFDKSSFFVYLDSQEMHSENNSQNKKTYPILVQFKSDDQMYLQAVSEKLMAIFDYVQDINGTRVVIDGFDVDFYEDDLLFNFKISFFVLKQKANDKREIIRELKLRNED